MGQFSDSVNKNIKLMLEAVDKKCYSITWQLFTRIIQTTPSPSFPGKYATGLLANQWYPAAGNTFSTGIGTDTSATGSASLARVSGLSGAKQFLGKDGTMTMTNNIPHAYTAEVLGWEYLGGKTKPYRMVFTALQKIAAGNK